MATIVNTSGIVIWHTHALAERNTDTHGSGCACAPTNKRYTYVKVINMYIFSFASSPLFMAAVSSLYEADNEMMLVGGEL